AAARLGAPLGHDFCAINLSDNLKPWELVERRLRLAAQAGFAMAFYNPRSRTRPHQFARALDILREECGPDRLISFARAVTTPEEALATVTLAEATPEMADMRTVVILGNADTRRAGPFVYTPRSAGCARKSITSSTLRATRRVGSAGRSIRITGRPSARAASSLALAPVPPAFLATMTLMPWVRRSAASPASVNGPRAMTTSVSGKGSTSPGGPTGAD